VGRFPRLASRIPIQHRNSAIEFMMRHLGLKSLRYRKAAC
jgi:hypothetical protein